MLSLILLITQKTFRVLFLASHIIKVVCCQMSFNSNIFKSKTTVFNEYFGSAFNKSNNVVCDFESNQFVPLSNKDITIADVKTALENLNSNKGSVLDGLSLLFYKQTFIR